MSAVLRRDAFATFFGAHFMVMVRILPLSAKCVPGLHFLLGLSHHVCIQLFHFFCLFRRTDYGLDDMNSEVGPHTASVDLCVGFLRQDLAFRVFFRIKAPRFRHD